MLRAALAAFLILAAPATAATICRPDDGQLLRFSSAADLRGAPGPDQRRVARTRAGTRLPFAGQVAYLSGACQAACRGAAASRQRTGAARDCVARGQVWFLLDTGRGRFAWAPAAALDPGYAAAAAPPARTPPAAPPRATARPPMRPPAGDDLPRGALSFSYRCARGERIDLVVASDAQSAVVTTRSGARIALVRIRGSDQPLGYVSRSNRRIFLTGDARRAVWADGSGAQVACVPR